MSMPVSAAELLCSASQSLTDGSFISKGTTEATTRALSLGAGFLAPLLGLLSLSPLPDWLNFLILSSLIAPCRRFILSYYYSFMDNFWITAKMDDDDRSYAWMLLWLSTHASYKNARILEITTRKFGTVSPGVWIGDYDDEDEYTRTSSGLLVRRSASSQSSDLQYIPSMDETYTFWYQGRYVTITRAQSSKEERRSWIQIRMFTRDRSFLAKMMEEARSMYQAAQEHTTRVYAAESFHSWRPIGARSKRRLETVILDTGIKEMLLEDCRDFLQSKPWYADRGIPFRRGYLLHGVPGSGKTSLIQSLAGELGLDIYIVSLSRSGMDDHYLGSLISALPENCIALMEDIDAAVPEAVTSRSVRYMEDEISPDPTGLRRGRMRNNPQDCKITLSGLLNALDGIGAQQGRILFATTNHFEALDPALSRPGRMDVHIEFKLASKYQAKTLFETFYAPSDGEITTDSSAKTAEKTETHDIPGSFATPAEHTSAFFTGTLHGKRTAILSSAEIKELAVRFGEAVPEREFSMAHLQGYLMKYKMAPQEAVKDAQAWVESELDRRKDPKNGNRSDCGEEETAISKVAI